MSGFIETRSYRRSFASLALLMLVIGCAGSPKRSTWKTATGAGEYEHLMWKAIQHKDWKNLEYHLAPTFVGVNAEGKSLDRAGWIDYWQQQQSLEPLLSEIQVHPQGPDMVVTFVLRLSSSSSNSSAENGPFRVISNWQQVKGGWVLTTTAITPILSR